MSKVSDYIREHTPILCAEWERRALAELPDIRALTRPALIDHLPEVLTGLCHWIDGDTAGARRAFATLAQGHAVQRLGFGIRLESLTREYRILREVLHEALLAVRGDEIRVDLIKLETGLDEAIVGAVHRYAIERDLIRERFIGILGHDLRNPLNAITMAAELLVLAEELSPRNVALAARIMRSATRIETMIQEVLGFAQGHLGTGIPVEPVAEDLGEILRAAVDEISAAHPERAIAVEITGDTRGAFDRHRVLQAMSNLLANAIHYGEDPIAIAVRDDGPEAVISEITNRGTPIPAEAIPTLFDPFRPSSQGPRRSGGLGLGLYIVHQIVLAHGATIDVTSTVEAGTRFTARWPRTRSDPGGAGRG